METIVEICCGSYQDGLAAFAGGAQRIELNSALSVGGLTPSLSALRRLKRNTDLKIICMARVRAAGFCYEEKDVLIMMEDAEELLKNGADGIAFGFLKEDASVDKEQTRRMVELIHSYGKEAVFHRAFDVCRDLFASIEELIACGVDRLLTSGGKEKALQGAAQLAQLQARYGKKIELLAGSGINSGNALSLIKATGIKQVHSSCKAYREDVTTKGEELSYSYLPAPHELSYDVVDERLVRSLIASLKQEEACA